MIKIVTDSTCCITREFAKQHDIRVIPLKILFSDEEFYEGFPGEYDRFYQKLESSKEIPKTSLPSPEAFAEAFDSIVSQGDEVICITLASALSGTVNSARVAAENFPGKISVIDSGSTCQSLQFMIEDILDLVQNGMPREEIAAKIEENKQQYYISFVPDTMEYLKRGGRISLVKASIATILKIKPIFRFQNNKLEITRKTLGMNMAINELVASIPAGVKKIFALCIGNSEYFHSLQEKLKKKFENIVVRVGEICPVLGTHVGPGTVGVACAL